MIIPPVPEFQDFSSDSVLYYFKLWELIKYENSYPVKTTVQPADWPESPEYIQSNEDNADSLTMLTSLMGLGQDEKDLVLGEKEIAEDFFTTVVDQRPFWTNDHVRLRRMIVDWYAAQRTLVTKSRHATDPYSLSDAELNDLILGFGFPYPHQMTREEKGVFVHSLIDYYHHKGTPATLGQVLTFFGMIDFVLSEWWCAKDPNVNALYMYSKPVWPREKVGDPNYSYTYQYLPFVLSDPYWHYDKEDGPYAENLLTEYNRIGEDGDYQNKITLPSITPYLSLNSTISYEYVTQELSVLNRSLQESFEWWIEYVLHYQGIVYLLPTNTSTLQFGDTVRYDRDVFHPDNNNTVVNHRTTDNVWNGTKWVDLDCTLPDDLLARNPQYGDQTRFTEPVTVTLNAEPSTEYSLLQTTIAAQMLLGAEYLIGIKRFPFVPTEDETAASGTFYDTTAEMMVVANEYYLTRGFDNTLGGGIYDPDLAELYTELAIAEREKRPDTPIIVRVLETESDHIFSPLIGRWIDLGYYVDFADESGNLSLVLYIPNEAAVGTWGENSLYYDGAYAPLDQAYLDTSGNIVPGLRDDIDDSTIKYAEIREEWDTYSFRPNDIITPISLGDEQSQVYSMWQQRQDNYLGKRNAFWRYDDSTSVSSPYWTLPKMFLEAMAPKLHDTLENDFFVYGLTYSYDTTILHKLKENHLRDLGYYLAEIGLTNLKSISYLIVGFAYWEIIKKVVGFLKPYRARFRELMLSYNIDEPMDDGIYVEDNMFPGVNQLEYEYVNITELPILTAVMMFEEKNYGKIFDGELRELDEIFLQSINMRFDEIIQIEESMLMTEHSLIVNDAGPFNFDEIRASDVGGVGSVNIIIDESFNVNFEEGDRFDANMFDDGYIEVIDSTGSDLGEWAIDFYKGPQYLGNELVWNPETNIDFGDPPPYEPGIMDISDSLIWDSTSEAFIATVVGFNAFVVNCVAIDEFLVPEYSIDGTIRFRMEIGRDYNPADFLGGTINFIDSLGNTMDTVVMPAGYNKIDITEDYTDFAYISVNFATSGEMDIRGIKAIELVEI